MCASPLTEVVGHSEGAVCRHPEEDSCGAADLLASSVHAGCDEHAAGLRALHEDVTRDRQVGPVTSRRAVTGRAGARDRYRVVLRPRWAPGLTTGGLL